MSDIFISYAREDRGRAEQLARVFERQGWTVWWDRELLAGHVFSKEIAEALAGAKAVIVLWSQSSVASNWVKDEAQDGAVRDALIPVLIDKIGLPLGFRQYQAADLSEWDGSTATEELNDLLRGVAYLIKKPVIKKPVTDAPPPDVKKKRRPTALYLAAGAVLCLALAFAAYKLLRPRGGEGGGGVNNNNSQAATDPKPCSDAARDRASDKTIEGMQLLDPDFKDEMAVIKFKEAIAACGQYADAYFYRGQSYVRLGDTETALEDFKKALSLSLDRNNERQARKFIAELEGGRAVPDPQNTNAVAQGNTNTNTAVSNTAPNNNNNKPPVNNNRPPVNNSANANGSQTNSGPPDSGPTRIQVADIFASDKTKRIAATTRLIIEKKQDAAAVKQAVASALANPENKSGVINTLVYLENVDPSVLKQNRALIEKLFEAVKDNGPQTVEHIKEVQGRLGG
ncbi:MAG TPA: TIR domain-containing protein [Pyrinomonadaceae bacterium]|jgi:tetratricopeptide (TPR) repeat protein